MQATPLVLGLDASTPPASVAVARGEHLLAWQGGPFGRGTDGWIVPAIQATLAEAGVQLADLDCVASSVGPGTFTGIRVSIATALGLGRGLGVPVAGVNTLEALAHSARSCGGGNAVLSLVDARRGQLYAAWTGSEPWGPEVLTPTEVIGRIAGQEMPAAIGSGTQVDSALQGRLRILSSETPLAASVAALTAQRWRDSGPAGLPPAEPFYLRDADARVGKNPLVRD